jgi:hypothetical protein
MKSPRLRASRTIRGDSFQKRLSGRSFRQTNSLGPGVAALSGDPPGHGAERHDHRDQERDDDEQDDPGEDVDEGHRGSPLVTARLGLFRRRPGWRDARDQG